MYISASILEILYINHDQFLVCVNQFVFPLYTLSIVRILLIAAILIVRRRLLTVTHAVTGILLANSLEMADAKLLCSFEVSHYIEAILYLLSMSRDNQSGGHYFVSRQA